MFLVIEVDWESGSLVPICATDTAAAAMDECGSVKDRTEPGPDDLPPTENVRYAVPIVAWARVGTQG
jgi:hypothetical protein